MGSSQDSSPNERSLKGMAIEDALKGMAFEDALTELESIVQQLEQGSSRLEESITIYERGEALKAHCERLLSRAQVQVAKITRVAEQEKSDSNVGETAQAEPKLGDASKSKNAESANESADKSRDRGGDGLKSESGDGEESFVREEMAVSNGDLVSSLARRG